MEIKRIEIVRLLLLINASFWLIFSLLRVFVYFDRLQTQVVIQSVVLIMMFGNGAGFLILAWGLKKWAKLFLKLSFIYVLINFVLTITDQVGILDYIVLMLNALTLFFIIKNISKKDSANEPKS